MTGDTSIGPAETDPANDGKQVKTRATTEGVDAQNANEFDSRHGLAGAVAKPFSENPAGSAQPDVAQDSQKNPKNAGRYEGGQTIREVDMPDQKPREGKAGLADNGG